MEKIQRINELANELNQYRHEYYNLAQPTVSDSDYDKLFDELSQLEKETGYVISNSPTITVGYEVTSKLNKIEHSVPLLSLDKTKSIDALSMFIGDKDVLVMTKADGLTVKLVYENGKLIEGSSRGSGTIGEEITQNVKTFKNIPLSIPYQGRLVVTGEAVIHYNDFEMINSKLPDEEKYKNPRNLTSGSVRQLNSKNCADRHVYFYAFSVLECEMELPDYKSERLEWLGSQGFWTIYNMKYNKEYEKDNKDPNSTVLETCIADMKWIAQQRGLPIDGLVISYESVSYSETLGATSHHKLDSLAYKFEDEVSETKLLDIEWSCGKNYITPVAIFEPVEIDGTTVSRASLHNISIMEELELGIGDSIGVIKANQIIPQVVENSTRSNNIVIPCECPVCKGEVEIRQDNASKVLICTNENCSAKFIKKLSHFVSRDAMNIDGLSEQTLEKLVEKGFIKKFNDIFKLEQYKAQIIKMDGFGTKSYNKLIESIEKAKDTEMYRVIYSQSIPLIGRSASKAIAKHLNHDMDKFLSALVNRFDFTVIEDFGTTTHDSIYNWYFNTYIQDLIELTGIVNIKKPVENKNTGLKDLSGMVICITGDFVHYKPRKKLEELIVSLGAKNTGSVSAKTNILVSNDKGSGSKKSQDAQKHGVQIMNEIEFMEFVGIDLF